ncbi:MAG: hypothetical protein IJ088_15100 [Clostridia bacterium]|nr:hypothetical protein [Clostridia bacterium]
MAYEFEQVRTSQEIFIYLLEHHELRETDQPQLYRAFAEDEAVQNLVRSQGSTAECDVERYGDVIYLIPGLQNRFLGYSRAQLKKELCRSNATDRDYYLVQFSMLVLLLEFYDGQGSSSKTRDYIRVGELQNSITAHLQEGRARESEEGAGGTFTQMTEAYEALRSDDKGTRQKTTKEGFIHHILRFLQAQGLIEYIEQDEMIKTTRKLDRFMDWNLLNKANYQRVLDVLGVQNE